MEWHELQIIVMYPLMRKNVIWRWLTLSLIDKGERSPEMIQMAHMLQSAAAKSLFQHFVTVSAALRGQNNTGAITYI